MANVTITGGAGGAGATLTNATVSGGVPQQDDSDLTVALDNASENFQNFNDILTPDDYFADVNFQGGDDTLIATNMPWVNPDSGASVGFEDINMGGGNDYVDLNRSGFRNTVDMGSGNDTLFLTNAGGSDALMGVGDDLVRLDNDPNLPSDAELAQKAGQAPLELDGEDGTDTLNLMGDWTLTLSSGDATMDDGGTTNTISSSSFNNVSALPALLNGTVSWGSVNTSDGNVTVETVFSNFEELNAVCFTDGTLIDTPDGPKAIETLSEGDLVSTRTGDKPIRWVGKRRLDLVDLMANPKLLPIRVPAGSFGNGLPLRDTSFSPQHRVVIRSKIAERLFGIKEALVAVKQLIGYNGVETDADVRHVTYRHIMLDAHDVVRANGIEAETLYPGPQALEFLSQDALNELYEIFPKFGELVDGEVEPKSILPKLKGRDGRALAARHIKNCHPIYS